MNSDGSTWRVRKQWRDVDRGVVFEAADEADVARFVLALVENDIRRAHGLGRADRTLALSEDGVAQPGVGLLLTEEPGSGYRLSRRHHGARWFFANDLDAARFSTVAGIPLPQIHDALRGRTRP
ncbi:MULTISPECIES: hypothetical protein [Microbacterium]|uniref:hypothetical protein n=1 Tax=Microbacterium TaxID=33882 RepID=UPI0027D8BDCB|nr:MULTISPECIES: hypothetical protein [Microbacterium]